MPDFLLKYSDAELQSAPKEDEFMNTCKGLAGLGLSFVV